MHILFSFLILFGLIFFTEFNEKQTRHNKGRTIASVDLDEYEVIKKKLVKLGADEVFNPESFQHFTSQEKIQEAQLAGTLIAEYDDTNPVRKKHKVHFFIKDQSNDLQEVEILNGDQEVLLGKEVEFKGIEEQNKLLGFAKIKTATTKGVVARVRPAPFSVTKKMLILLFKFNNSSETFTTAQEVENATFGSGAFNRFFQEMTDQKIQHTGRVYGFYHLNREGADDGGSAMICDISNDEIKEAINFYGINITEYDQITTVSNCSEYFTIGGRAILGAYDFLNIGHPLTYIKMASKPEILRMVDENPRVPGWNPFISILVHERGHNFGLMHSNALDCGDSLILYPCENIEYGNKFDRMGGPDGSYLFNAHQQKLAGFKNDSEFLHIKESGTYRIDKLTSKKLGRKIGAYIYNPQNLIQKVFMLEYRKPDGMDNNLSAWIFRNVQNGALLYSSISTSTDVISPSISSTFRIVDAFPTNLPWHQDTAYESLQGEYKDSKTGISITTYSPYSDSIEFSVSLNPQDSICGKSTLSQWSDNPYIRLYYQLKPVSSTQSQSKGPIGFGDGHGVPGGNPLDLVPKYSKEVRKNHIVLVPGDFFHFKIDTLIGESMICDRTNLEISLLNPSELQPYFYLTTTTQNGFKKTTKNINQKVEFPILKVPAVDLNKNKVISYQIKNKVTGEVQIKKLFLYIRSTHNAIIPMNPEK